MPYSSFLMSEKHFILATAGHIDHGKSALVKALTGTDPDRLPEEKARGITIDLGFANLRLPPPASNLNHRQSGPDQPSTFSVGVIDVPGHEDFVRNMIAGVGSVDLALLVVAANDGWMPQTEEHVQILSYLGVKRAVVALTKSDLGEVNAIESQISEKLADSPFANSPIIPTSVRTGDGIENLKTALASEFAALGPRPDLGKPRLFVDRAFSLHGIGSVVTGTLAGGQLQHQQNVIVQSRNVTARIRSLQNHGHDVESAHPGMRTAVNLTGVEIGKSDNAVRRGDVVTLADFGKPSDTVDILIERSNRIVRNSPQARPLKSGSSVSVHFGAGRVSAKIVTLDHIAIGCGESAIAQLRLQSSVFAFVNDRLILRDSAERNTIAGGTVLDPDGDRRKFRRPDQVQFLRARAAAPGDVDLCCQTEIARRHFVPRKHLLAKSNFSVEKIAVALSRLQGRQAIVSRNGIIADAGKWNELHQCAVALIERAHQSHPEARGLEIENLRAQLQIPLEEGFDSLISDLCENDFTRNGTIIARASHRAALPPQLQTAAEAIRKLLATRTFDPPSRKELAPTQSFQAALRFLIETKAVIDLGSDVVVLREAAEQMEKLVVDFISSCGSASASQLRQQIGTSRRIIIPFLEYLDRKGVTQRIGDQRRLNAPLQQKRLHKL